MRDNAKRGPSVSDAGVAYLYLIGQLPHVSVDVRGSDDFAVRTGSELESIVKDICGRYIVLDFPFECDYDEVSH